MKNITSLTGGILITTLFFLGFACNTPHEQPEIIRPVRYAKVYSTGGTRTRTFSGVAKAGIESDLSFKVPGTVQQVAVKVGDSVRKSTVIAALDREDYEIQVQQARASLRQGTAQRQKAAADYERIRALYENNNASKSDLDAARAAFESTRASVEAAEKQLELAELQLSYTRLLAPSDGSIASVDIDANENVQPGQRVVMLTAGSDIEVEVAIPEILISQIEKGSSVAVTFDAVPGTTYPAVVREVGVASTAFATTFPVTVRLAQRASNIRSGMAAEVSFRFESADRRERILVPSVAVAEDRQGRFLYVVQPVSGDTAIVHRVGVQIGELTDAGLEVFTGLTDGDLVVTAGVSRIQDGQKVRL